MIVSTELPMDLVEAPRLAAELGINYKRLKMWWQERRVTPYKRGDGRILLSRSEVLQYKATLDRIVPLDGHGARGVEGK